MIEQGFGKTSDGRAATLYVLRNKNRVELAVTNYGATLVSLKMPNRAGELVDVTAGYDNVAGYETGRAYIGATVGRYANRIGGAKFSLDGKMYTLPKNNGPNHLHGGFNKKWWKTDDVASKDQPMVRFSLLSEDGDEGYPGNLFVQLKYTLNDRNEVSLSFDATTDEDTVINLTNHSYFNLAGHGNILDHEVTLFANRFLPVNAMQIPTGEIRAVENTPFDFRRRARVGERIDSDDEQIRMGDGYDHTYVLDNGGGSQPALAVEAIEPRTHRVLEVLTTEPGIQFYTGNHLDGSEQGKGKTYVVRSYMCFETQHFPDSPNHPKFPSTVLRKGSRFQSQTIYRLQGR